MSLLFTLCVCSSLMTLYDDEREMGKKIWVYYDRYLLLVFFSFIPDMR